MDESKKSSEEIEAERALHVAEKAAERARVAANPITITKVIAVSQRPAFMVGIREEGANRFLDYKDSPDDEFKKTVALDGKTTFRPKTWSVTK